jgi:hypothetical protein
MMHQWRRLVLAFALALPAQVAAQADTADPIADRLRELIVNNPAAAALDHRRELGLRADQVSRLEAISTRVRTENQKLVDAQFGSGGAIPTEASDGAQPGPRRLHTILRLMAMMRQNQSAAGREAAALLTEDQQLQLRELLSVGAR